MLRLLIDENVDHRVLRGLKLRCPDIDYIIVQNTGLRGADDRLLLDWAVEDRRVIVTQDIATLPDFAFSRVEAGLPMAGVIVVSDRMPIGKAIEELILAVECYEPDELEGRVVRLPL